VKTIFVGFLYHNTKLHNSYTITVFILKIFPFNTIASNFIVNIDNGDSKKLKKLNPKIISLALIILTVLATGGLAVKHTIAPSGFGQGDEGSGGNG
jgi:hypothetical protein